MEFMNLETGEILFSIKEMHEQAKELYDWGDDTNFFPITEYYKRVK